VPLTSAQLGQRKVENWVKETWICTVPGDARRGSTAGRGKERAPVTQPGLLTKLTTPTSQDQCAPTILTTRCPDVATAGRAKAALRQLPLSEERDPVSVLLVTG
jgi:hypothetical protein